MALEISLVHLLPTPHGRFLPALPPVPSQGHTHILAKATRHFVPFPHPHILMQCFFHLYWNVLSAQPLLCILPCTVIGFVSNSEFQRLRTLISQSPLMTWETLGKISVSLLTYNMKIMPTLRASNLNLT